MITNVSFKTVLLVIPLLVAGCAPAYHAYPHGCVHFGYCPPTPLPLVCYPPRAHCVACPPAAEACQAASEWPQTDAIDSMPH